ncbi:DUF4350 domain-containing protein [Aquibacillus halophilus]|uniref:DUF4350 domain-containing protein n=1 Tax=Aquibacillus halophilus TaxID=930132 RepID=A0A6A8DBU7_9BACI|nr:DUF4350 domain-containing protein [Aquibacillus halophilus]MRH43195.1 DUF4350 domain-containing protein [Aquibacillus halophilus]
MSIRRAWFLLAGVLLLFILTSFLVTSPKPEDYPDYVSDSPSPTGLKGVFTYLENASRWSHSPRHLSNQDDGPLLIMVQPFYIPEAGEMEDYMSFIQAGNTILLVQANPSGMFDLKTSYIEEETTGKVYDQSKMEHSAEIGSTVRLQTNEQDKILLYDEAGTIAFKRFYGKGQLIVSNTPEWFTNEALLEEEHLQLVLSLINEGSPTGDNILFDEYSHGADNASSIQTLYPKWLLALAVQLILLTAIWLWYLGKRFGPILIAREETVRYSDERIKALAAWYQRSRSYQDSIIIQANYLKLLLQERWGIPYHKEWADIAVQLERKLLNVSKIDINTFLTELSKVLRKEKISKQEFLVWSKKIDSIRKEVDKDEERTNILT